MVGALLPSGSHVVTRSVKATPDPVAFRMQGGGRIRSRDGRALGQRRTRRVATRSAVAADEPHGSSQRGEQAVETERGAVKAAGRAAAGRASDLLNAAATALLLRGGQCTRMQLQVRKATLGFQPSNALASSSLPPPLHARVLNARPSHPSHISSRHSPNIGPPARRSHNAGGIIHLRDQPGAQGWLAAPDTYTHL
jgi:hypothetical protein